MSAPHVVVVGAGLTGLVAAYRLVERGAAVSLVEASSRLGGQIHTVEEDGCIVELGAEGFVHRSQAVPKLCEDLGIEDQLLDQETTLTFALVEGSLQALAPGEAAAILGFQVPKEELGRGIRSMRRGMGQLVERLVERLGARVAWHRGVELAALEPADHGVTAILADGRRLGGDGAVVTIPAAAAAPVLAPAAGDAARALATGRRTSNASVTLRYERARIRHDLAGSGFIVPAAAATSGFRACSFVTSKFARPFPTEHALLRAFFRPTDDELATRDERAWTDLAVSCVRDPLGIEGPPRRAWVSVWPRALPVYDDDYRRVVLRLEEALAPAGIRLAGSHFHGAGVDAAVASAERAAAAFTPIG